MEPISIDEKQYREQGFAAQRQYPNESFLAFLGSTYFRLPPEERRQLSFLELGCGSGANLWAVAREGFQAHGLDLSPTGLDYCGKMLAKWGATASLQQGDMTQLPYPENRFDVIFDVVAMQHVPFQAHRLAWQQVHRCLKPGGRFFSYHLGENSYSFKCGSPPIDHCTLSMVPAGYPLPFNGPICFLSGNEVRLALGELGFSSINIEKVVRSYSNQKYSIEYLVITAVK